MTATGRRPNTETIHAFWEALVADGDVHEVRIPKPKQPVAGKPRFYGVQTGYFNDAEALVQSIGNVSGHDAEAVYITLNPTSPDLLARANNRLINTRTGTADSDITRLRNLLIDIDAERPSGISATDAEKAVALATRDAVQEFLGWTPAVVADTGNGGALIYWIDLENTPEHVDLLRRFLAALAELFDSEEAHVDTGNFNPSRLVKISGTVAAKGEDMPERPWRLSDAAFPAGAVPITAVQLQAIAGPESPQPTPNGHAGAPDRGWSVVDLLTLNDLPIEPRQTSYGMAYDLDRCLTSSEHEDGACLIEMRSGALVYRCQHNSCQGKDWRYLREHDLIEIPGGETAAPKLLFTAPSSNGAQPYIPDDDNPVWEMPKDAPDIDPERLPYWLSAIYRHIKPLAPMFPSEWPIMMTLPFWSILWPGVRLQNLNLGVWTLGIGRQGGGKNLATDELQALFRSAAGVDVKLYTAGSPEGLWEALEGTGRRVIAYHDEYAGLLKLFSRDHMSHAREALCSLYDMRDVGYLRSKGKSVQIIDPFIAVVATTTASALREHGSLADLTNGYLSRFMICAPDRYNVSPDFSRAQDVERSALAREIAMHRNHLAGVSRIEYAETGRPDPPILNEYREHLGMDTGEIERLEDSLDDASIPGGRLLARVKKVAGLFALADLQPERNNSVVYITEDHLRLAIDVTELGYFYAERVLRWIGASDEVTLSDRILDLLKDREYGLTRRDLCRRTKRRASEVQDALRLLLEEGQVINVRPDNKQAGEKWMLTKVEAA